MNYDEYEFTDDIEANTKVALERLKIDYKYENFDF